MRLSPGAPDLVASLDGSTVAMALPGHLRLFSPDGKAGATAELPDGEPDVGFVGQHLLCIVRGEATHLVVLALPSLEVVAQLELEERLRLLACVGIRALIAGESLEHPRIVTVTSVLVVEPIAVHTPLIFATAAPDERLLVASRGRDQQLECWDPVQRRALFRLNLPLMPKAQLAGFASRRRLLWIAATGDESMLELYRFSDGRLQARADLGGNILGAAGHPESPRLIVAVKPRQGEPREGELALTALDFAAGDRYELTPPVAPVAFCVAESASPSLVLHDGGGGPPLFVPLARALPADVELPPPPVLSRATRTAPVVGTLARAQGRGATPLPPPTTPATTATAATAATATAHPPRVPLAGTTTPPARETTREPELLAPPVPREGTWRDRLCEWSTLLLADPRRTLALPELDDASPLADAVERLELDGRTTRALALLYGARLLGQANVPAATVARVLADGTPPTQNDWDEALGRGLLTRVGLARARRGRLLLRGLAARFLDGAPPRLTLVPAGDGELPTPPRAVVHDGGEATLAEVGATLAARFGCPVALVPLPPAAADARPLVERALLEARLHGAWPLVAGADPAAWVDALLRLPSVILVRGAPPPSLSELPRI